MTTACDTFFAIPELLLNLSSLLSRNDLHQLSQTNHAINSICKPFLWRELNLSGQVPRRFLDSPEHLKPFLTNIHYVRDVKLDNEFTWPYFQGLYNYLSSAACSPAHKSISIDALSHPTWGRLTTQNSSTALSLPPIRHLTHYTGTLKCSFLIFTRGHAATDYESHHHHLFWLLRLNSESLRHLKLSHIAFFSAPLFRDACRTLAQLRNLRTVCLRSPFNSSGVSVLVFESLFFSCPSSLVEFNFPIPIYEGKKYMDMDPKADEWDYPLGPVQFRQEPFRHLKAIELPVYGMLVGSRARSLCSILKHCPTIEKLTLPLLKGPVNVQAVSETICDHCPNITDLVLVWSGGNIQDFPMRIMERMREQRLQTLKVPGFIDGSSSALSFAAFSRHSQTLQKIDFPQHQLIKSTTLQAIHISCQALEVLKAHDIYSDDNSLLLNDAVESEWVCAKIRRLEISVKVTSRGNPYYLADSTKASWTEQDHQHWGMLDKFYTQIGKLTDLEILKITSEGFYVLHDDDHLELSQDFCFPGLLALEDEATGQIGFLSRWAGLTKLRDLDGSFLVTDEEVAERMGEREVDWFVTHLPALRHASFVLLPDSEEWSESDIPEIVHSIKRRRPEIEVLDFLPW